MFNRSAQISLLRNQIAQLEQQDLLEKSYNPSFSTTPNVEALIQKAVQDEIQKLIPNAPVAAPSIPETPIEHMTKTMNQLASEILTPEQIQWLSNPAIFNGIMVFLKSGKGKEAISLLIDEYKSFLA